MNALAALLIFLLLLPGIVMFVTCAKVVSDVQNAGQSGAESAAREGPGAREESPSPFAEDAKADAAVAAAEEAKRARRVRAALATIADMKPEKFHALPEGTLKVTSVEKKKRWVFDRTGYLYFDREPVRGSVMLVVDFTFTAPTDEHDPHLPVFVAYAVRDGKLRLLDVMSTEFHRWSDHGAYLGNYHDSKNDFSHTATIRFSAGAEIPEETMKGDGILVGYYSRCMQRTTRTFQQPAVRYVNRCDVGAGPEEVAAKFRPVALFNKKHLESLRPAPEEEVAGLQPASVEFVDCRKQGAPAWCERIEYATDGEKTGTLAAVIRGELDGAALWCAATPEGFRYMGAVGSYVPAEVSKEQHAITITLVPRDADAPTKYRYFVSPKDVDASGWEWMEPCPL